MKKSENKALVISFSPDLVGSIVFMAVSVFFLFSMEKEVYVGSDDGVNARTFPFIVLFLMLSISLFMFIKEIILIARKKERKKISIYYFHCASFICIQHRLCWIFYLFHHIQPGSCIFDGCEKALIFHNRLFLHSRHMYRLQIRS